MKETLYKKDSAGNIREWSIEIDYFCECLVIEHGLKDGVKQIKEEYIDEGKANRTIEEQLESRFNSRINNKIDNGYVDSIEKISSVPVTGSGFIRPMLAKRIELNKIPFKEGFLQFKYNGHRCLITCKNGKNIAYTRKGKIINSIDHILNKISIPEGTTIDGELYIHDELFENITSYIKRKQENSKKLFYIIYDVYLKENYGKRIEWIKTLKYKGNLGPNVLVAITLKYNNFNENQFRNFLKLSINKGYEGAILRNEHGIYEPGKRSSNLIKLKTRIDEEFRVEDIILSRDNIPVLVCSINEKEFTVTAPGTFYEKNKIYINKEKYIGKMVTIEFPNLTKKGIPCQPVAIGFKDDEI